MVKFRTPWAGPVRAQEVCRWRKLGPRPLGTAVAAMPCPPACRWRARAASKSPGQLPRRPRPAHRGWDRSCGPLPKKTSRASSLPTMGVVRAPAMGGWSCASGKMPAAGLVLTGPPTAAGFQKRPSQVRGTIIGPVLISGSATNVGPRAMPFPLRAQTATRLAIGGLARGIALRPVLGNRNADGVRRLGAGCCPRRSRRWCLGLPRRRGRAGDSAGGTMADYYKWFSRRTASNSPMRP